MSSSRSFGQAAEQMKGALQKYSKDELIDLMTHIVKTYVVEGTLPLRTEGDDRRGEEELARLSFPQLVLHLQMRLDHREWSAFSVSGEDVWVSMGGQRINLTSRHTAPSPGPSRSGAYEPIEPPETRLAREGTEAFGTPTDTGKDEEEPPPESPAEEPPDFPADDDAELSERFGMLEID